MSLTVRVELLPLLNDFPALAAFEARQPSILRLESLPSTGQSVFSLAVLYEVAARSILLPAAELWASETDLELRWPDCLKGIVWARAVTIETSRVCTLDLGPTSGR